MPVTYEIDFHIPIKELDKRQAYTVEAEQALTAHALLGLLSEQFPSVRLLMDYGRGKRPPVAILVNGRSLEMNEVVPDGARVRIIGAVAGG